MFDSVFLLSTLLFVTNPNMHNDNSTKVLSYLFEKFLYPVYKITITGSIYMTIVLALERYTSTNQPIAYQRFGSGSKSYVLWYLFYVLPVTVFSILYNLPLFFEFDVDRNGELIASELLMHPYYATYYHGYGRLFITGVFPFVALLFFNIMVFKKMKQFVRASDQSNSQKEYQLARVLIVMVLVFLICHIPRICLIVSSMQQPGVSTSKYYLLLISGIRINNLFLAINSSVNVLIYGCLNEKFRSVMFCRKHNAINTEYNLEVTDMATQLIELPPHVQKY